MKKNFGKKNQSLLFAILSMALVAAMMFIPATVIKSEAAQGKMVSSEKQHSQKRKPASFRAFLGDTTLQGQPSGAYYTVYFSYLPTIAYWQVDGVDDFYGNPVTINSFSASSVSWNGSVSQLTLNGLSIDLSVAGGTDHINDSFTLQMH